MPTYICQGRFTREAMRGMMSIPEDRTGPVSKLMEGLGGKLLSYYVTFGEYDWLLVCEAPNEQAVTAGVIAATAGGGVSDVKTTVAMTGPEAMQAFSTARDFASSFKSAGQPG